MVLSEMISTNTQLWKLPIPRLLSYYRFKYHTFWVKQFPLVPNHYTNVCLEFKFYEIIRYRVHNCTLSSILFSHTASDVQPVNPTS